jgi:hypothetical protein
MAAFSSFVTAGLFTPLDTGNIAQTKEDVMRHALKYRGACECQQRSMSSLSSGSGEHHARAVNQFLQHMCERCKAVACTTSNMVAARVVNVLGPQQCNVARTEQLSRVKIRKLSGTTIACVAEKNGILHGDLEVSVKNDFVLHKDVVLFRIIGTMRGTVNPVVAHAIEAAMHRIPFKHGESTNARKFMMRQVSNIELVMAWCGKNAVPDRETEILDRFKEHLLRQISK